MVLGARHLEQVLSTCVKHYNEERPHRGLELNPPGVHHPLGLSAPSRARSSAAISSADSSTSTTGRLPERDGGGSAGPRASDIGASPAEQRIEARLRADLPLQAFTDRLTIAP